MVMACNNLSCKTAIFSPVMKNGVQDFWKQNKTRKGKKIV
jgi:hypothetical protein